MDDSPRHGSPSSCGSTADPFGDDEAMGGLLKSLISAQGLQAAWQRVAKRLQVAEQGLRSAQARLDGLPSEYVSRAEWDDTVLRRHAHTLDEHGKAIAHLKEFTSDMHTTALGEQARLREGLLRTQALEEWRGQAEPVVRDVQQRAEELQHAVRSQLEAARREVSGHTASSHEELGRLQAQVRDHLDGMSQELEALETRAREFTRGEINRSADALLSFDGTSAEAKPSPQQAIMLDFVGQALVDPLRNELSKAGDRIDRIQLEMERHREEMQRQISKVEKNVVDVSTKMKQATQDLREDLESRAKKADVAKAETLLSAGIGDVTSVAQSLNSKVVLKLNEFMDHFSKLQDAIDDHEHCLRHHAEEIENRGTKYDVLICQNQIDKCIRKDEFTRDTQDLRKVMSWQSSKIESFGLITRGLSAARARSHGRKLAGLAHQRHGNNSSAPRGGSRTSASRTSENSTGGDGSPHSSASIPESLVRTTSFGIADGGGEVPADKLRELPASVEDVAEADLPEDGGDDELVDVPFDAGDGEDASAGEAESEDGFPAVSIFRQQLEALAMGLVGLGHLLLREPKLGMAREARLRQEKDMLDELQNLCHWITNRMAPSGWDPAKITTVALACSHPRQDELKRPLPQVSLKGILQEEHRQRRYPSLDTLQAGRGSARAKMATGTLITDHLAKAPFSARGVGAALGTSLPPLHGLTAVAA